MAIFFNLKDMSQGIYQGYIQKRQIEIAGWKEKYSFALSYGKCSYVVLACDGKALFFFDSKFNLTPAALKIQSVKNSRSAQLQLVQNDGIANTITNRASTVGANIVGVNFEVSVIIFGVGSEAKGKQDKLWILYNTKSTKFYIVVNW